MRDTSCHWHPTHENGQFPIFRETHDRQRYSYLRLIFPVCDKRRTHPIESAHDQRQIFITWWRALFLRTPQQVSRRKFKIIINIKSVTCWINGQKTYLRHHPYCRMSQSSIPNVSVSIHVESSLKYQSLKHMIRWTSYWVDRVINGWLGSSCASTRQVVTELFFEVWENQIEETSFYKITTFLTTTNFNVSRATTSWKMIR